MRTFVDAAGRTWTVAINVDAIKRVRGVLEVNLLEIVEGKLLERLIRDPVLLCDIVYVVCKPQADQANVSDEEFGRAMAGDAIENATTALVEELVSFSPNPRDRAMLRKVLEATYRVMDQARGLIEARIDSGELDKAAAQALANASSLFTEPQAQPA